jgi:hypothetical protein
MKHRCASTITCQQRKMSVVYMANLRLDIYKNELHDNKINDRYVDIEVCSTRKWALWVVLETACLYYIQISLLSGYFLKIRNIKTVIKLQALSTKSHNLRPKLYRSTYVSFIPLFNKGDSALSLRDEACKYIILLYTANARDAGEKQRMQNDRPYCVYCHHNIRLSRHESSSQIALHII